MDSVQFPEHSSDILFRNRKKNLKIHMETQKSLKSQNNTKQNEQCQRSYTILIEKKKQHLKNLTTLSWNTLKQLCKEIFSK